MPKSWLPVFAVTVLSLCAQDAPDQPEAPPPPRKGKITAGLLNVRARPGTRYEVLCQLKEHEGVSVLSQQDDWVEVQLPPRAKAWIAERFVDGDGVVTGDRVRVHSGPGLVFTTYAHVNKGDRVERQGEPENRWQRIDAPVPSSGWVSAEYVKVEEPPAPEPEPAAQTPKAAAAAADAGGFPGTRDSPSDIQAPPGLGFKAPPMAGGMEDAVIRGAPGVGVAPVAPDPDDPKRAPLKHGAAEADRGASGAAPEGAAPAVAGDKAAPGKAGVSVGDEQAGSTPEARAEKEAAVETRAAQEAERASVPLPPTGGDGPKETGQVPEQDASALQPREVAREGVVLALERGQVSEAATHVLSKRIQNTFYPVCYLRCRHEAVDLGEWEFRDVRVYGRELWYPGWEKAVVDVTGIQLRRP